MKSKKGANLQFVFWNSFMFSGESRFVCFLCLPMSFFSSSTRMNSPPAVADPWANNCLNNVTNGPAPDAVTRAGKAAKRLKLSNEMFGNRLLTTPEYGEQHIYAITCAIEGMADNYALPQGAPAWAVAMNANINANINATRTALVARLDNVVARLDNVDARFINATATDDTDAIVPLTNRQGVAPNNLPQTFGDLRALQNGDITRNLLEHYGLPANPIATRNMRLSRYLGCRV